LASSSAFAAFNLLDGTEPFGYKNPLHLALADLLKEFDDLGLSLSLRLLASIEDVAGTVKKESLLSVDHGRVDIVKTGQFSHGGLFFQVGKATLALNLGLYGLRFGLLMVSSFRVTQSLTHCPNF